MIKHSVSIRGHRTSVSLERLFWDELQNIALREGLSVSALVTRIDADRSLSRNLAGARGSSVAMPGLSSAIRVFILNDALMRASR